jgi:hypothetical protein
MANEKDLLRHLRWLRYAVGGLVLIAIVPFFISSTKPVHEQAKYTALSAAVRAMQEQLNQYHSYWLLNDFPESIKSGDYILYFDDKGWIIPLYNGKYDCNVLLDVAYPKREIFGEQVQLLHVTYQGKEKSCIYLWGSENRRIEIRKNVGFIVSVR